MHARWGESVSGSLRRRCRYRSKCDPRTSRCGRRRFFSTDAEVADGYLRGAGNPKQKAYVWTRTLSSSAPARPAWRPRAIWPTRSLRAIVLEARDRIGGRVWSHPTTRAVRAGRTRRRVHSRPRRPKRWRCCARPARQRSTPAAIRGSHERRRIAARRRRLRFVGRHLRAASARCAHDESVDASCAASRTMRRCATAAERGARVRRGLRRRRSRDRERARDRRRVEHPASIRPARGRCGGYGPLFEHLRDACAAAGVDASALDGRAAHLVASRRGRRRRRSAAKRRSADVARARGDRDAAGRRLAPSRRRDDVAFEPALPAAKRAALQQHRDGSRRQGRRCGSARRSGSAARRPLSRCGVLSQRRPAVRRRTGRSFPVRSELIVAWAGGPKAIALRRRSRSRARSSARSTGSERCFGEPALARARVRVAARCTIGSRDPFARGAYSYVAVGGGDARSVLGGAGRRHAVLRRRGDVDRRPRRYGERRARNRRRAPRAKPPQRSQRSAIVPETLRRCSRRGRTSTS